jgi:hypothetical protein
MILCFAKVFPLFETLVERFTLRLVPLENVTSTAACDISIPQHAMTELAQLLFGF